MFLCGVDPPVLKLQKFDSGFSEYVSVVQSSSQGSPSSLPEEDQVSTLFNIFSLSLLTFDFCVATPCYSTAFLATYNRTSFSRLVVQGLYQMTELLDSLTIITVTVVRKFRCLWGHSSPCCEICRPNCNVLCLVGYFIN